MYLLYWDYDPSDMPVLLLDLEDPAISDWTSSINLAISGLRDVKPHASLLTIIQILDDKLRTAKFEFETLEDLLNFTLPTRESYPEYSI